MNTVEVKPIIEKELLESLQEKFEEEKQVIVNCYYHSSSGFDMIRVWPSTFLIDLDSDHVSQLIHAENISMFPQWTDVPYGKDYCFTLIFSGLPKSCERFDLAEIIPESNGFYVESIKRNKTDIYHVKIE